MPKAEKEFILNYATNRWQLNFKRNVGALSDHIRICAPSSVSDWEAYYFDNVYSREHLEDLGNRLYRNITQILPDEDRFNDNLLNSINLNDCVDYIYGLVITKTFNGYMKEHGR